ncbi:MAG TPA: hypothetical protein VLY63_18450 [Anaerolineae bacterium]|nr:hypothetical protein [Anaerolineae bacterium]
MTIKGTLTRVLLNGLPANAQDRMAADVVAWLCADLPAAQRQEKIEKLGPRLLKRIRAGQFGLRLVVYYHLLRLPPFRWLDPREAPAGCSAKKQLSWLVCRWY